MNWEDVLSKLKTKVPVDHVTTYKEIALWAFGKPTGAQTVVAMFKTAVNASKSNFMCFMVELPNLG